ncbi:ribonuclease H-like domain-containing protein [Tanacetum coccineum]
MPIKFKLKFPKCGLCSSDNSSSTNETVSWRLCDFCGIHILLMENGLAIHMLTEKKHPLSQELLSKMLRQVPVNAAKQSSLRAAASITTARPVNNVTTAGPKAVVSAVEGNRENAVKFSACYIWRPTGNVIDHISTDGRSYMLKFFNYVDLQGRLKIFDTGCSRHMIGNKSYLTDYQEIDGGFVAFGGNAKGGKLLEKVSHKCVTKKNSVLFTDTECVVLSLDFKLPDESQNLLKVTKNNNMYSFDLKNVVPLGGLTCCFANATLDESNLWHRRLSHINFKTMNKLVRENLVRGLPSKLFENDHTYVACQKGKQHKASYKTKTQNGIAERKNRTLIEAARTMLADSKLPTTFWAEAVNTACYVQNRVLVIKPHNKTPYELFLGRKHALSFMRPFGCPVTILNTLEHLGKFDGKFDDRFFVGYSINSKAFKVFNTRTRFVEENLHINFLENKLNVAGTGPNWMFDIDTLTMSMNYQPVSARNQTNGNVGPKSLEDEVADDAGQKNGVLDLAKAGDKNGQEKDVRDQEEALRKQFKQEFERLSGQRESTNTNNTNRLNTVSSSINVVSSSFTTVYPRRERAQRNEFESVFRQDKGANDNSIYRMFTPVSAAGSSYDNPGGSIHVNAATLPNANLLTNPLMPDLEDTADL